MGGLHMSIEQMRQALKEKTKYSNSINWHRKVDGMSDNQVYAVYMRMLNAGELSRGKYINDGIQLKISVE